MKALLLVLLGTSTAHLGFGQGTVFFLNGGITFITTADRLVYASTCDAPPFTKLVGTNYAAALYYAPGAAQIQAAMSLSAPMALGNNGLGLAYFRPPTTSNPGVWLNPTAVGNFRTLVGVLPGEFATLQVRVWDAVKYATFNDAFRAGEYSWSSPFDYRVPQPGDPPNAYYMDNLRAWAALSPPDCPEPSPLALVSLAGLGGAIRLVGSRRRRTPAPSRSPRGVSKVCFVPWKCGAIELRRCRGRR